MSHVTKVEKIKTRFGSMDPILRIKWDAKSYVRLDISHTHKPTNYK